MTKMLPARRKPASGVRNPVFTLWSVEEFIKCFLYRSARMASVLNGFLMKLFSGLVTS
jgi:hypothetical protein